MKYFLIFAMILCCGCSKKEVNPDKPSSKDVFIVFASHKDDKDVLVKYNILKDTAAEIIIQKDNLLTLSLSEENSIGYFVTGGNYNSASDFPSIKNVKINKIEIDSFKIEELKRLGDCVQIFALWNNENLFQVVYDQIDPLFTSYIKQTTLTYNTFGKEIYNQSKTYELAKEGFPLPPSIGIRSNSPNNTYSIIFGDSLKKKLAIKNNTDQNKVLIKFINKDIKRIIWNNDENIVVINTGIKDKQPDSLIVYSITGGKMIDELKYNSIITIKIIDDYLLINYLKDQTAMIDVYKISENKKLKTIKYGTGCYLTGSSKFKQ